VTHAVDPRAVQEVLPVALNDPAECREAQEQQARQDDEREDMERVA
jgi:hypothetical protein